MKKPLAMLLPALLLSALAGCGWLGITPTSDDGQPLDDPPGGGLVADPQAPLPDVPRPIGFVLVPTQSKAKIDTAGRTVDHVYQGLAGLADGVVYYRRTLASHGWQAVSDTTIGGTTTLVCRSPREDVKVELSKPSRVLNVHVWVTPIRPSMIP